MLEKLKKNWKSGFTVALVSIPLSVSLAVASQATPVEGILTAVWAGLVASLLGGSNYNIVGPAGALSGILASFALAHGSHLLPSLAVFAGVFVLLAWALKLEKYLVFVPAAAVHGFTLGVAVLIAFGQLNSALGIGNLVVHEKFADNLMETVGHLELISPISLLVFLAFLFGLFAMTKWVPRIPPVIALAPIGMLIGYLGLPIATLGSKFPNLSATLLNPGIPVFDFDLMTVGMTVAVVAILETLLSAKIADGMTKTHYDKRKEMLGLGFANLLSGIFGGLPATAVLARTSLNVKSGATDKISATINAIVIALVSLFFLGYFKYLPLCVVAAILFFVAIRMVEREHFAKLWHYDRKGFWLAIVVGVVTVWEDPIMGILLGTAVSLLILVEKISHGQFDLVLGNKKGVVHKYSGDLADEAFGKGETLVYSIKGQLLHLNVQAHLDRFEKNLFDYKNVVLRLRELYFLDLEGVDCLSEIIEMIEKRGRKVAVTGVNKLVGELLVDSSQYKKLVRENRVFSTTTEALKSFGHKVS